MAKKKGRPARENTLADQTATLKDLLGEDIIAKLKEQANGLKREEEQRREELRMKAEEARRAERKRLENDFEHLLNTSDMDWHKYK